MTNRNSSSSDEDPNYRSNINLPAVNLANLRKKDNKIIGKSNLSKAKKKLTQGQKTVRFPENSTSTYGDSVLNSSSAANFALKQSDAGSDSDDSVTQEPSLRSSANLPNFTFEIPVGNEGSSSDNDSDESDPNLTSQVNEYNDDSSDEEEEDTSPRAETDIADIRRSRSSHSSRESPAKKGSLEGIFRHMSLSEKAAEGSEEGAPSRSDTFLGKVLNFAGGGSMSGGGLAPGATVRNEEQIDDEKEVGFEQDKAVEMRNLDFAELGEEAQNLIFAHAPDLQQDRDRLYDHSDSDIRTESTAYLLDNEKPFGRSSRDDGERTLESPHNSFYQPNTNLFGDDMVDTMHDEDIFENDDYIAPPKQVHAGVLSSLLKLYQNQGESKSSSTLGTSLGGTLADEQFVSGEGTKPSHSHEFSHIKNKVKAGPKKLAGKIYGGKSKAPTKTDAYSSDEGGNDHLEGDAAKLPSFQNARPKAPKLSKPDPRKMGRKFKKKAQKLRITVHIADILQRQRFIIRMCRALMLFGAPTHRLEEYMVMTSRVLEIDGQFVYFPGTMIVAFGDAATRTSEVHLVRCAQGLNLSKLSDTHKIYKDVIHDLIGVEEAAAQLDELLKCKNVYSPWVCVLLYGLGSASVCTWGFGGGWFDVPIAFGIGLLIGYLQFFMSSKSHLYSSVFEVSASIVVSFIARGIGSIQGGKHFCFGAIAQGSLALILPGYIILCGSLELQAKNLVAGSVRMFYAIIYSLFLGFGITLGAALYGWVDHNATDAASCATDHGIDDKWRILMVPLFSICLGLINQARWNQLPVQTLITAISYVGTYFSGKHFSNVTEFTAAIGAFIIGILGNMYSRVGRGMAVSAMLPAIFVQVPSGIASKSTLLAGVQTANRITSSSSNSSSSTTDSTDLSSLSFGATMVEVSIGISVGLFAAALVVYPFGKRRSGLFTL